MEILLCYRQLFIKGDIFIGVCGIFGADIFLCYSQFFVKGDFVIGRVECKCFSIKILIDRRCASLSWWFPDIDLCLLLDVS